MKIKKGLCILMSAGLMLTAALPCSAAEGDVTADSLISGYMEKSESCQSVTGKERLGFAMRMAMLGQEMSMKMDMQMDIESTQDISHVSGEMNMVQEGSSEEDNMEESSLTELYSVKEDETTYTVYTLDPDTGVWTKSALDDEEFNFDLKELIQGDTFELGSDLVDVDGTACYEVKGAMALSDMMEYMGGSGSMEGLEEIIPAGEEDAENYNLEVLYYFNAETGDLVCLKMDGSTMMETLLQDAMAQSFAEMDEDAEFDVSELMALFEIEVPEFVVEISDIEFDTVESIEVPEEVLAAEESVSEEY